MLVRLTRTTPKAVLFDFDGTLVDTENIWKQAKVHFLNRAKARGASYIADAFHGVGLRIFAQSILEQGIVSGCSVDEIVSEIDQYANELSSEQPPLMIGASALLKDLANSQNILAICSNAPAPWISNCLSGHGLNGVFTGIFSSAGTAFGKPHPHVYLSAIKELGISPAQAIAIEDSASGVRAAVAAGLGVVLVGSPNFDTSKCMPTAKCASLLDLSAPLLDALRNEAKSCKMQEPEHA